MGELDAGDPALADAVELEPGLPLAAPLELAEGADDAGLLPPPDVPPELPVDPPAELPVEPPLALLPLEGAAELPPDVLPPPEEDAPLELPPPLLDPPEL